MWSEPRGFCRFVFGVFPIVTQLWSLPFEKQLFSALLYKESIFCGWGGGDLEEKRHLRFMRLSAVSESTKSLLP